MAQIWSALSDTMQQVLLLIAMPYAQSVQYVCSAAAHDTH